jgi:ABC-type glycerol-3-phosphate transport system substrate-binding protein
VDTHRGALVALLLAGLVGAQPRTIELEFPSWQIEEPGAGEFWTEITKAFEAKNPNVRSSGSRSRSASSSTSSPCARRQQPADIVHLPSRNFLAFASQGWLAPLDDVIAQTTSARRTRA